MSFIRTNGCKYLEEGRSVRQVVYTNMIGLAAYTTYCIHSTFLLLLANDASPAFYLVTGLLHLLFFSGFLLIRYNKAIWGKHLLIIAVYAASDFLDHIGGKQTFTILYFFAVLPAAMNIFSWSKKNIVFLACYVAFPFIYTVFTRLRDYSYPRLASWDESSQMLVNLLTIFLGSALFILFSGYMILNNLAKQRKLLVQSISLQATLDNAAASIWSIDKEFNLTVTNTKYTRLIESEFGISGIRSGMNIRNHELWQKLPPEFRDQYHRVLAGNEIREEITLNNRYYEIKAVPVYDMKGNIQGATFGSRDITERKKSEEALLKAKQAAEDAGVAKARFLSNMSHELRTPLNGIIGITRIMQDEEYLPSQHENLKTMQDLSEHTLQVINNILDFAKIEAGKSKLEHKRFNLKRFIDKTQSLFAGTAQLKGIRFITEIEGEADIFVQGDEVRLSQVLINMLGNAFKFTEKGSITFKTVIAEETATHYHLRFFVIDTGIGIRKENIDKIFESFSQADANTTRRFGGTGLGVTIADKILRLMDSRLMVTSEYGKGSSFWCDVVLDKSSNTPLKINLPAIQQSDALMNVKILLAEDNKVNQIVANRILQKWKALVSIASNGQEAIDLVDSHKFDVVLMDLDMPVMDGYEATAVIKDNYPEIPVVALTAASFDDMNEYLAGKGFSEVVQKPFIPDDLYAKIAVVLQPA